MSNGIFCGNCSTALDEDSSLPREQKPPCPNCGSLVRNYFDNINETIEAHDSISMKQRRSGERKPCFEGKTGADFSRQRQKMVHREMMVDHEKDDYLETVTDPATGEIIHHCHEPLSEHRGHGSAKGKEEK